MKFTWSVIAILFLGLISLNPANLQARPDGQSNSAGYKTHYLGDLAVEISPELAEAYSVIEMETDAAYMAIFELPFETNDDREREFAANYQRFLEYEVTNHFYPTDLKGTEQGKNLRWEFVDDRLGRPAFLLMSRSCDTHLNDPALWSCFWTTVRLWVRLEKGLLFADKKHFGEFVTDSIDMDKFDCFSEPFKERMLEAMTEYLAHYEWRDDETGPDDGRHRTDHGWLTWPEDQGGFGFGLRLFAENGLRQAVKINVANMFRVKTVGDWVKRVGEVMMPANYKADKPLFTLGSFISPSTRLDGSRIVPLVRPRTVAGRLGLEKVEINEKKNLVDKRLWMELDDPESKKEGVLLIEMSTSLFGTDEEDGTDGMRDEATLGRHWDLLLGGIKPWP